MNIVLKINSRRERSIELYRSHELVDSVASEGDVFELLHRLMEKNNLPFTAIEEAAVEISENASQTTVKSAYALVNALNYSLKLKAIKDLTYPEAPKEFYSRFNE